MKFYDSLTWKRGSKFYYECECGQRATEEQYDGFPLPTKGKRAYVDESAEE